MQRVFVDLSGKVVVSLNCFSSDASDEIDVHVGARIRFFRKARRLTLHALGAAIGTTYQQIQKYELGSNRVSASQLWRLAQALDVPVEAFFPNADMPDSDLVVAARIARMKREVRRILRALIDALAEASGKLSQP